jgi:hypothetical protein
LALFALAPEQFPLITLLSAVVALSERFIGIFATENVLRWPLCILTHMRGDESTSMDLKSRVHPTTQHAQSI